MSETAPDPLPSELLEHLPKLFDEAWEEVASAEPRDTTWLRQVVGAEVLEHGEEWLTATSSQVAALRDARKRREAVPRVRTWQRDPRSPVPIDVSRGLTGTLAAAFPVAVWQAFTYWGFGWALLPFVVATIALSLLIVWVNERRGFDDPTLMLLLSAAIAATVGYAVAVYWFHPPGNVWIWLVWIVAGVLVLALDVAAWYQFYDGDELEEFVTVWVCAVLAAGSGLLALQIDDQKAKNPMVFFLGVAMAAAVNVGGITLFRGVGWRRSIAQEPPPPAEEEVALDRATQAEVDSALAQWRDAFLERAVKPYVQRRIGESLAPPFKQPLRIPTAPGLGQLRAGDFLIATDHFAGIRNSVRLMRGGALGVAGPRGAGKSTLMEAYQLGALADEPRDQIVALESVPVRYEAREFALHLYARLCEEVQNFTDRRGARRVPAHLVPPWPGWRPMQGLGVAITLIALAYITWVQGTNVLAKQDLPSNLPPAWAAILMLLTGVALVALAVYRRRPSPPPPLPALTADQVDDLDTLRTFAGQKLRRIRFQQHFTQGWSGKLALPGGPELTRTDSTQWAEQAMTYPDVIYDFRKFLETSARVLSSEISTMASPPIAILIDELDKISTPGKASEFINEIKALFSPAVEGCLFVVAVSEDALASFQRRGLPVRDEFDSAFDTIVRVDYLSLADSFTVLRSRVLGLGVEHCSLIYCLAGGLPRDLIRMTRSIVHRQGTGLAELARSVIAEDVKDKADALRTVIVHGIQPEPQASNLIHSLDQLAGTPEDSLASAILAVLSNPPAASDVPSFNSLRMEALGHLYFCLTLLDIFGDALEEEQLSSGTASGPQSFTNLARARQLFAVNARASWLSISAFRTAWTLKPLDQPAHPGAHQTPAAL